MKLAKPLFFSTYLVLSTAFISLSNPVNAEDLTVAYFQEWFRA